MVQPLLLADPMRISARVQRGFAATLFVLMIPAIADGQTWRELYDRGEYDKAAAILHPLVVDALMSGNVVVTDVDATEALARLYWDGKGVPQDRILGCSFVSLASASAAARPQVPDEKTARIERLDAATCGSLSEEERAEAGQMVGCPGYGPDRHVLLLDANRVIEVSRRGILIGRDGAQQLTPLPSTCFERIAFVRHARVEPPATAAREIVPRHFIEVYSWVPLPAAAGERHHALQWKLAEVVGRRIEWREVKELTREPGSTWIVQDAPSHRTDVSFEMSATGETIWRFGHSGVGGVLDALPESRPSVRIAAPASPTTGPARLDVTVVDRFDAPLDAATVTLTGVVNREFQSDAAGTVRFESLPEGRYDVVASARGLLPSVPRVVDLSGSHGAAVALRLKPMAPTATVTLACGVAVAHTTRALVAGANLVVHVKVIDQTTSEAAPSPTGAARGLTTVSRAQVLQFFKAGALPAAAGSTIQVQQEGGSLDRGDYIDHHQFNRVAPLNIGDEYVLFLYEGSAGTFSMYGSEEGVFRVRNGRVESLGGGEAASAWKGHSTNEFFAELRTAGTAR